ncbi:hypothetical protein D3877_28080 [Azospirillum cavernae]|uniref:AMIN domain-containing protein n=1 Tax=Azospirillum cavernae TaxID=2320860 RepID=A0A418VKT4_9PROT|nr:hypothetical protein [Azospirillum cavernae]RJF76755.1 hypothetical protein D3877_28080 [Azospirillum cavernae]
MFSQILRLTVLLLTPLWLSLGVQMLDLRVSLPGPVLEWARKDKVKDLNLTDAPIPGWRETTYLAANPDVAAAVKAGQWRSGYDHYRLFGRAEGRPGAPGSPKTAALPSPPPPAPPPNPAPNSLPIATQPAPAAPMVAAAPPPANASPDVALDAKPTVAPPAAPLPVAPVPRPKPTMTTAPTAGVTEKPSQTLAVTQLRAATNGGTVRVVLDLDGPPRFTLLAQRAPNRLELVLPGTLWKAPASGAFAAAPLTYRLATSGGVNHLILGGQGPIQTKTVFVLPPEKEHGHRLVIDVAVAPKKRT